MQKKYFIILLAIYFSAFNVTVNAYAINVYAIKLSVNWA